MTNETKQYTGTKTVLARPMNRGDYNAYRGWEVPADENPADEGVLVEYTDGGKANHPAHAGYISWSPADVFACAYVEDKPTTFQDRVRAEHAELADRTDKLAAFFSTPTVSGLDEAEQSRLRTQWNAMSVYRNVLVARIKAFS